MKRSPRQATTFNKICSLQTDNKSTKGFWILIDEGVVHIHKQKDGESSVQEIEIPRRDFHALIDWYNREQETRKATK